MTQYAEPTLPAVLNANMGDLSQFDKDLVSSIGQWAQVLQAILDKGISLHDNVDADVVSFTSNAAPNTEDAVAHNLKKVPSFFIVGSLDKGGVVYKGSTAFTETHVYLKNTVASVAVTLILL